MRCSESALPKDPVLVNYAHCVASATLVSASSARCAAKMSSASFFVRKHFQIRFAASDSALSFYNKDSASVFIVECFNMFGVAWLVVCVCVAVYVLCVVCTRCVCVCVCPMSGSRIQHQLHIKLKLCTTENFSH